MRNHHIHVYKVAVFGIIPLTYGELVEFALAVILETDQADEIAQIRCAGGSPPVSAERRTGLKWKAFLGDVDTVAVSRIEHQLAGIIQVILTQECALGTTGSFDHCHYFADVGSEPGDNSGCP